MSLMSDTLLWAYIIENTLLNKIDKRVKKNLASNDYLHAKF